MPVDNLQQKVLVVDDSRAIRNVLCAQLQRVGEIASESAASLDESRQLLAENPQRFLWQCWI